jgi:hypothetical protein
MPLVATTLADELNKIEPAGDELQAANAWSTAFLTYLSNATGADIPAVQPIILTLAPLMTAALQGVSTSVLGPQKIQDAITAVWAALIPLTATVFPGTIPPLTPPTGNTGIAAAILAIVPVNTAGNLPRKEAMRTLAEAIHLTQIAGGLVTLPGPVTGPIL